MRLKSIILKDLIEALRNKTFLIVILLPLLASLFFSVINNAEMDRIFTVGIIEDDNSSFLEFVEENIGNFTAVNYSDFEQGETALEKGSIEGLILINNDDSFTLYIDSQQSLTYYFLKDSIQEFIKLYKGIRPEVDIEVVPVNVSGVHWSFLPVWITITITMIGVVVLSGNIAEEKESKTLDALLVTPAEPRDILLGKGCAGIILIFLTVFIMFLVNRVFITDPFQILTIFALIVVAALCFSAIGLFIGNIAGSQSTARSLSTIIYFPLLFPALIYDLSEFTRTVAVIFPTFHLLKGLEKLLFYQEGASTAWFHIFILASFSVVFIVITLLSFRGWEING
ncbi:MAG TPA: ABC transporter permease [Halanaerobiales bacterium]|nr:ABC transporter permease [Halanaerobiales bacterium]